MKSRCAAALCAAMVAASGCRWSLRAVPDDAPATDAASDSAARARCSTAGPPVLAPTDPAAPLAHYTTLVRPTTADVGRGACLGDIDGDGSLELIVLRADAFAEVYDPRSLCLRATMDVPPYARACVVDDLDGDGAPELALAHSVRFGARFREQYMGRALDSVSVGHVDPPTAGEARFRWRWPAAWSFAESRHVRGVGHVLVTLDLDRDGARELAVAGTVTTEERTQGAFVRSWEFSEAACAGERRCPRSVYDRDFFDAIDTNDLFVVSIDPDPEPELVADLGCNGGGLYAIDAQWSSAPRLLAAVGQPSHGAFGDVDGDGAQDYLAAITPRCTSGANSALRWLRPSGDAFRFFNEAPNPEHVRAAQQMATTLDAMGDQRPEALLCSRNIDALGQHPVRCDLFSFDSPHVDLEWSWIEPDAHADMISRLLVHDVNGDGRQDALIVTQSRVHLLVGR